MMRRTTLAAAMAWTMIAAPAAAGSSEDATAVVEQWVAAFNGGRAEEVAGLFHPQAVAWGTVSSSLASTPDAIKTYFVRAFGRPVAVRIGSRTVRAISDSVVVVAGDYEFIRAASGNEPGATIPASYDFTVVRDGAGWRIAAFHSSRKP